MTTEIWTAVAGNATAMAASLFHVKSRSEMTGWGARLLVIASWVMLTVVIISSWVINGRPPFKTLYESLLLLAWCLGLIGIASLGKRYPLLWAMITACIVSVLLYAVFNPDSEAVMLPPALQSFWFVPHVVVYFIGYSALIIGSAGLLFSARTNKLLAKLKIPVTAEDEEESFSLKTLRIGYLLLTIGLITGAVWADEAWGVYWGWDPKESWALITFLVYGAFFHLAGSRRNTRTARILLAVGLFTILFTYLGIHLLPSAGGSMHVYQ